jgi:hypothetical protein
VVVTGGVVGGTVVGGTVVVGGGVPVGVAVGGDVDDPDGLGVTVRSAMMRDWSVTHCCARVRCAELVAFAANSWQLARLSRAVCSCVLTDAEAPVVLSATAPKRRSAATAKAARTRPSF